jgi:hypothetical protein
MVVWCHALIFDPPPSCSSNLVIIIVCLNFILHAILMHARPTYVMWDFTLVEGSVMVSWLVINGAATKPRASCGRAHKAVLLGTRWYRDF